MEMENERAETIDVMVFTLWNTTLELEDVAEIFGVTLDSALRHAVLSQVIRCHECRLWVFTNEIHNFLCPKCKTTAMQWSLRSVVTNYDVELLRQMGIRW